MSSKAIDIRASLKRILEIERNHMFGVKTGSQSSRRRELEEELDRLLSDRATEGKKRR
jgi:hypothetical protein